MIHHPLYLPVTTWFCEHARDLPWRHPTCTPWGILVSEVMSQQTPLTRVEPIWIQWLNRWPDPRSQTQASGAEVIRAWAGLGYPRRALRLLDCAEIIVTDHDGEVPHDENALLALPGIGNYTAAAIQAFAFTKRSVVLDTNIRRVISRCTNGIAFPPPTLTGPERNQANTLVPDDDHDAANWNAAIMELGALVCTAKSPQCENCPISTQCQWIAAGKPAYEGPRRSQPWKGTDRQMRGRIMALLRVSKHPVTQPVIARVWAEEESSLQGVRCLNALLADGLVHCHEVDGTMYYALPGST